MPNCAAVFQIIPNINNLETALFVGITEDLEASMAEIRNSKDLSVSGHSLSMAVIYEIHNDAANRWRRWVQLVNELKPIYLDSTLLPSSTPRRNIGFI
ncbi:MAG TPA: hypothetical protein VN937_23415 [Blastocatellia bacterium]|nr:hypothetical protein [Blastocatellia bacterium]